MTDPFDTVREALSRVGSALNLSDLRSRSSTEFYDAAIDSLAEALTSLASIEERLREAERLLEIERGSRLAWRSWVEKAEAERDALQHIIDCADTPLMRDVLRERDEALNAARNSGENQPTKEAP